MAITTQERTNILKLTVGLFNAAPGANYLSEFTSVFEANGHNLAALAGTLGTTGAFQSLYPSFQTASEFATKFLTTLGLQGNTEAVDFVTAKFNAGVPKAQIIYDAVVALDASTSAEFAAAKAILVNKAAVAENYSVTLGASSTSLETLQGALANVTADPASVTAANAANAGGNGQTFMLTQYADNFTGNAADNVFLAPVTQNETGSGELANTFETGDVLNGGAGRDVLRADLIDTGTIQDGQISAVISATTTGVEEVYLRAQRPGTNNTIDAEKMDGVEQWWSDNSRATINIEDIRTDTAATTFGMRMTDPAGVSLNAYFNALYLEGDVSATSAMTLNIYEGPLGAPNATTQLENITVREIAFTVEGEQITLDTEAIRAADTWAELETALNDALAAIEGAETITLINRGNGQFVFEDSAGREFQVNEGEALVLSVTNNITVTNSLAVGREEVTGPVISNAVLDGAGNGSQGGALNIGAMSGLRGVEELNLSVDRDSHVTSITSFNQTPGQYSALRNGDANEFLEVVDVTSIGAEGDLTVGRSTANLDGRVNTWNSLDNLGVNTGVVNAGRLVAGNFVAGNSGFVNLRELNTADFNGALNVALTLDNNTISRYLDAATEAVTFSYNGGAQNDIFNIADVSTLGVSGDQDFAMEVDMGAGDDRLVLTGFTARAVSVDGGEGENSIVVAQSHGTNAANTFAAFANFQTYEVEGNGNPTVHDFTSMSGIENVVIATGAAAPNTQLIDLEAAQNVTVSGKNQTVGNASTADQNFGTIQLTNDAGTDRTITLDNTARLSNSTNGVRQDGVLTVNTLTIDTNPATTVGATRNVTIESAGERTAANAIAQFNGRDVETLTLTGTQDLTINVATIADQAANTAPGTNTSTSVQVSAAGLTGNLNLALNGAMLNNFGATPPVPAQTDRVVGTAGANDTVMFYGALTAGNAVTASAIERVQLGSFGAEAGNLGNAVNAAGAVIVGGSTTTMLGDLAENREVSGALNVANLGTNAFVVANVDNAAPAANADLQLTNLTSGATITLGDAARNAAGDRVASQELTETLAFSSQATTAAQTAAELTLVVSGVVDNGAGNDMSIAVGDQVTNQAGVLATANTGGFRTINLDIERDITIAAAAADDTNISLLVGSQARTLDIDGGLVGKANGATADTLVLGSQLLNSLEVVDISGYNGQVTLTMQQGVIADATETDVAFVMSGYNADITLSNEAAGATAHNSTFDFNVAGSVTVPTVWTIDNIIGANEANATINNTTLFDLRDLGITNYAQVEVIYGDGATTFALDGVTLLAAGEATIRSEAQGNNDTETWEIIVTGVAAGEITAANFIF